VKTKHASCYVAPVSSLRFDDRQKIAGAVWLPKAARRNLRNPVHEPPKVGGRVSATTRRRDRGPNALTRTTAFRLPGWKALAAPANEPISSRASYGSAPESLEQFGIGELAFVDDHVCVRSRGCHEVVVAHKLADPRPRHAAEMEKGDAAVAKVVR
jgi:hypothetical protein